MMSRRSMTLVALISVALTSVVAGCISGRALQIYVLNDATDTTVDNKAAVGRTELQLERVLVPDYLDTTSILLRAGEHELHSSASGRWGERLSLGIMHALLADLVTQLPQDRVMLARPMEKSARQILVNVDAFDVWPNGHCVLAADWTILGTDRTVVLAAGRGAFIVPSAGSGKPSDGAIVSAMAEALRQLAENIALAVKALPPRADLRDAMTNHPVVAVSSPLMLADLCAAQTKSLLSQSGEPVLTRSAWSCNASRQRAHPENRLDVKLNSGQSTDRSSI
jgi:uncharacterized lipoprotein YmbA